MGPLKPLRQTPLLGAKLLKVLTIEISASRTNYFPLFPKGKCLAISPFFAKVESLTIGDWFLNSAKHFPPKTLLALGCPPNRVLGVIVTRIDFRLCRWFV